MKVLKPVPALILILACLFCGCAKKDPVPPLEQLGTELHEAGVFTTEISLVDTEAALSTYALSADDMAEAVFYFSSGASADELALVKAASEDAAKTVEAAFKERVLTQKTGYADYMPEEVPKLENALVQRSGLYVLLCVAEDTEGVQDVLNRYF